MRLWPALLSESRKTDASVAQVIEVAVGEEKRRTENYVILIGWMLVDEQIALFAIGVNRQR